MVSFLKTIQDPEIAAKKTSIVDIMYSDEVGNQYIVEMQVAEGEDFVGVTGVLFKTKTNELTQYITTQRVGWGTIICN